LTTVDPFAVLSANDPSYGPTKSGELDDAVCASSPVSVTWTALDGLNGSTLSSSS